MPLGANLVTKESMLHLPDAASSAQDFWKALATGKSGDCVLPVM